MYLAQSAQSACEDRPDLALSFKITSQLVIRFQNGAAQTDCMSVLHKGGEDIFLVATCFRVFRHYYPVNIIFEAWICPVLHYSRFDTPGFLRLFLQDCFLEYIKDMLDGKNLRGTGRAYDGVGKVDPIWTRKIQPSAVSKII